MRRKSRTLTELELRIMQIIWQQGEVTVKDLADALAREGKPLALPSIRTMLTILQAKGYLTRKPLGRGHAYRALVSAAQAQKSIVRDIVERAFGRSAAGLVAALVNSRIVSRKELAKVKQVIEQREKEGKR